MLSYHFNIPFPEQLEDAVYWRKYEQLIWVLGFENKRANLEKGEKLGI
ncbi:hypothetical protein QWY81_17905 [Polaribacter undariae]|uniref:Uncharacterized protein n=1 Tax=Polaribacter sejongensis TaxID=985043 RepID=A0AAJ1R1N8_9FLAO|nr:hypothetical protein [Polaribacter undariae]MDN3621347.1 hypothetical protein [Polaribacter undariae]UWD31889.1 hypothetical protein NQP51_17370 [Polaribacter undariae]